MSKGKRFDLRGRRPQDETKRPIHMTFGDCGVPMEKPSPSIPVSEQSQALTPTRKASEGQLLLELRELAQKHGFYVALCTGHKNESGSEIRIDMMLRVDTDELELSDSETSQKNDIR